MARLEDWRLGLEGHAVVAAVVVEGVRWLGCREAGCFELLDTKDLSGQEDDFAGSSWCGKS